MAEPAVRYLFRGTTAGFPGSVFPRHGLTSLTADPVVATLFATTLQRFGPPLVLVVPVGRLTGALQDRRGRSKLAALEAEFVVAQSPESVAGVALTVGAGSAKAFLEGI